MSERKMREDELGRDPDGSGCSASPSPDGLGPSGEHPSRTVARTVAEAVVGDFLWHLDRDGNVYRDGKYIGRGKWTAVQVQAVGRQSVEVGDKAWPRSYRKYARDTGLERGWSGHGYQDRLYGLHERTEYWWRSEAYRLSELVKNCGDVETLKTIAFALGASQAPDFSNIQDREAA